MMYPLIELVVVISIVALTFGVALERLLKYQEMGERAGLEQNLAAINSALTMRFAAFVISGRPEAIQEEAGRNPITLLDRAPENYLGELYMPDEKTLPRASWYFDRATGELVYVPNRRRYLSTAAGPPEAIRFRVGVTAPEDKPSGPRELRRPFIVAQPPFSWVID